MSGSRGESTEGRVGSPIAEDAASATYFDWNATTPPHPDVVAGMLRVAREAWGNPASVHALGRRARAIVEDAREAIAALVGADPRDVVLTSGATEANNLALRGATALVTSRIEHPSVVQVAEALEREGRRVVWLPVPETGRIRTEDVERALSDLPSAFVVALMAANHETGVLQPVGEVAELVAARGGRLHVDAVQAAGKVEPAVWQAGDTLSLAAHKIRGPKAIGALVLRSEGKPEPVLLGGSQERGVRPGTVDPVLAHGFGLAAARAHDGGPSRYAALAVLRDRIETALAGASQVNGRAAPRLPHVSNLSFPGHKGDELVAALDLSGLCVSSGSACSAGTSEPSSVIRAMLGSARSESALRVSLGEIHGRKDVERAISIVNQVLAGRFPSS